MSINYLNVDHAFLSRKLQAKQELAAFFQELLQEHTRQLIEQTPAADSAAKALALKSFQSKLVTPNNDKKLPLPGLKEVLEFSRMFKDDFVLEKMDLQTLQVMCKLLGLQPYSVRSHVVLQLRHHINHIQREDRELLWEGVESLTHEELVEACRDRGMKFYKTTDDEMREQMRQWLEVSSHRDVPPILLLWSRCVSMVPAAQLQPTAAAAAATAGAAEAAAEPSISLAAVAGQQAAADDKKKEEEAAAGAAAAAAAADADTEAETLRKTASLEAMTKQVELLKEEEESLRQTITLLQEERAQHAQMQKMQRHPEAAEDESAESEPTLASVSQEKQQEQQQQQQKQQLHREQQQQVGEADATETKERRDCRDVERELRLLRQLTDIQHEHEERQFHVFNQVQMAVEALKSKLAPPPPKPAPAAAAAAGKGEAADKAAAGEPATGEATKVPAGEGAAAAAEGAAPDAPAAGEVLEEDPNEIIRQRAAELLHDELRELELCMQLLAREFAEDAKEVEHFMTDARTPPEELEAPNDQVKEEAAANTDPPAKTDGGAAAASPTASKKE
ncbi:LETM1 and EF-hand domain-containing protein anon-60Da, mitochondrial, related [Eimeria maxima]|uniref:LETM1 and EF-hand domain-containing protein anon-60Da, mitochondrial, related n=1 Tax=Eimeria maxima TaxID=5804 RepID=U6MEV6_EIMMA|nr:LETM1 and EF-hand domain-containing protein anon-60Da, mitochondrial, related [Eimeria maxima]CDJ60200.1 LETM1 and EF-hand domain-containing protein anon-60Da, mitochondrial, related [Eimeria maxima]